MDSSCARIISPFEGHLVLGTAAPRRAVDVNFDSRPAGSFPCSYRRLLAKAGVPTDRLRGELSCAGSVDQRATSARRARVLVHTFAFTGVRRGVQRQKGAPERERERKR